ncbi:hypothetical protein DXG01_016981 [Tephrocybe rancida]|nr:hypothetical protein DXG01_016981 [Tephrocybe rancida]
MSNPCIIANPDISGIGVRLAIYLQNFLTFAPVVVHLSDWKVTRDEVLATEGQSIGILSIAFAILVSTIIEAKASAAGASISRFHAAVILNLSWMNNTSAFVWFLLYAHSRSKPERDSDFLRHGTGEASLDRVGGTGAVGDVRQGSAGGKASRITRIPRAVHRFWNLVSQAPVLTLGSIHLSLMAAIGIWLWSNPTRFGTPINCDPSLTIVGGAAHFSSPALRIFSLIMYGVLLIPGVNLIVPFVFFLSPHIMYNQSRLRHPRFWERCQHILCTSLRHVGLNVHQERHIGHDLEAQVHDDQNPGVLATRSSSHPAFLVISLGLLFAVNIVFLADIELTLSRNQRFQSHEEDNWGFGQVLALLLLVIPLRDLFSSVVDIRQQQKDIQKQFENSLRLAIKKNSFEDHNFQDLIACGADLSTQIEGINTYYWYNIVLTTGIQGMTLHLFHFSNLRCTRGGQSL